MHPAKFESEGCPAFSVVMLSRAAIGFEEALVDCLTHRGISNRDEVPRLHEADRGRMMRRIQDAAKQGRRNWVGQEARADVAPLVDRAIYAADSSLSDGLRLAWRRRVGGYRQIQVRNPGLDQFASEFIHGQIREMWRVVAEGSYVLRIGLAFFRVGRQHAQSSFHCGLFHCAIEYTAQSSFRHRVCSHGQDYCRGIFVSRRAPRS
jgi:hypothetical protein